MTDGEQRLKSKENPSKRVMETNQAVENDETEIHSKIEKLAQDADVDVDANDDESEKEKERTEVDSVTGAKSSLDCVLQDRLFISSVAEAQDVFLLKSYGITHVLTLGKNMPALYPQDFSYQIVPEIDDTEVDLIYPYFAPCFTFIDLCLSPTSGIAVEPIGNDDNRVDEEVQLDRTLNKGALLVHCDGGVSRSATIVIAYLMDRSVPHLSFEECFAYLKHVRSVVEPNSGFKAQLKLFQTMGYSLDVDDSVVSQALKTIVEDEAQRIVSKTTENTKETVNIFHSKIFFEPTEAELHSLSVPEKDTKVSLHSVDIVPLIVPKLLQKKAKSNSKHFTKGVGTVSMDDIGVLRQNTEENDIDLLDFRLERQQITSDRKLSEIIALPVGKSLLEDTVSATSEEGLQGKAVTRKLLSEPLSGDGNEPAREQHYNSSQLSRNDFQGSRRPRFTFEHVVENGMLAFTFSSLSNSPDCLEAAHEEYRSSATSDVYDVDELFLDPTDSLLFETLQPSGTRQPPLFQKEASQLPALVLDDVQLSGLKVDEHDLLFRNDLKSKPGIVNRFCNSRRSLLSVASTKKTDSRDGEVSGLEEEEEVAKTEATQVVAKVLLGHNTDAADSEFIKRFLAFKYQPIPVVEAFKGVKQALQLIRKLTHVADLAATSPRAGRKGFSKAMFDFNGLRLCVTALGTQLEQFIGFGVNSKEFMQLLRSKDGLNKVMMNIDKEYSEALFAVKEGPESPCFGPVMQPSAVTSAFSDLTSFSLDNSFSVTSIRNHSLPGSSTISMTPVQQKSRKAQIDMLLLFSKLGLRRDLSKEISAESYNRLAEMLEGGTKETAALESIDQDSLIELLGYLDQFTSSSGAWSQSRMFRLKKVCESRLALMVDKTSVDHIFDHLIDLRSCSTTPKDYKVTRDELQRASSVRSVASYCLYFTSAVIAERMLRVLKSRQSQPLLPKVQNFSEEKDTGVHPEHLGEKNELVSQSVGSESNDTLQAGGSADACLQQPAQEPDQQGPRKRRGLRRWVTFSPGSPQNNTKAPVEPVGRQTTAAHTTLNQPSRRESTLQYSTSVRSATSQLRHHKSGSAGKLIPVSTAQQKSHLQGQDLDIAQLLCRPSNFIQGDQSRLSPMLAANSPERRRQLSVNSIYSFNTDSTALFPINYYDLRDTSRAPPSITRSISTNSNFTNEMHQQTNDVEAMLLKNFKRRDTDTTHRRVSKSLNPIIALNGILKHLSRLTSSKLASSAKTDNYSRFDLQQKLMSLHQHSAMLKDTHPLICVSDSETRPGLCLLPKASSVLKKYVLEDKEDYGVNQTPYIFDFGLKLLVFFKPCDHDTALQKPNDTSGKFRRVLKAMFQLLPEGFGEMALNDLTETATFSQHASAGFALSTVLHYIDKNTPNNFEKFAPQLRLGDDRAEISGTVAGGYLHYSKSKGEIESDATETPSSSRHSQACYIFTEESGHYGRRWTIPGVRSSLAEFMEDSGLADKYVLKPYHREEPLGTLDGLFGKQQSLHPQGEELQDGYAAPVTPALVSADGLLEDIEWDFG